MIADQKLEALAKRIARQLFTNFAEQRANRLVLEMPDGRMGGGWCEEAAADHILETIRQSIRDEQITKKHSGNVDNVYFQLVTKTLPRTPAELVWDQAIDIVTRRLVEGDCCVREIKAIERDLRAARAGKAKA